MKRCQKHHFGHKCEDGQKGKEGRRGTMVGVPSYLILALQFTELSSVVVRDGGEATLSCEELVDQVKCNRTTWSFSRYIRSAAVNLVTLGQTNRPKSDRLSLMANCSLMVKRVTAEDVGRYFCLQLTNSIRKSHSCVDLSVVNLAEHQEDDKVILRCSVSTYGRCRHTVKWQLGAADVDQDGKDLKTSQSHCSANVTVTSSHYIHPSKGYKCRVTDGDTAALFTFSQPTGEKTGSWWVYVIVAVGLAALLITVQVVRWKKNKVFSGNTTQTDENTRPSLNPAGTQAGPGTSQDTADPEDGVSYASIVHTNTTNSKARVQRGDHAVTYSTMKAPLSSAGASTDPSNLYATIN